MKKWILALVALYVALLGSYKVYDYFTDDFRIANITDPLPFLAEYEVAPLSVSEKSELLAILQKRFSYLGRGGQTYAFASDDGKYVLKLFKFKHHRPTLLGKILPPIGPLAEMKRKHFEKAEWKFYAPFKGYKLAYDRHRRESGLLFVHLNKTSDQFPTITVYDKLGLVREITLDEYAFAVQKKGETFETILKEQLDRGDMAAAKKTVGQMYALFRLEYERGLFDRDFCVMRNTGFVEGEAIRIDIGQLCPDAHEHTLEEHMAVVQDKLADFLIQYYPQQSEALLAMEP